MSQDNEPLDFDIDDLLSDGPGPFDAETPANGSAESGTESAAAFGDTGDDLGGFPAEDGSVLPSALSDETFSNIFDNAEMPPVVPIPVKLGKKEKPKKEKKEKPKKEKKVKPKRERSVNAGAWKSGDLVSTLCLSSACFLLLGLVVMNLGAFAFPPKGAAFMGTVMYLVLADLVGLFGIVAVPLLYFKYKDGLELFKVLLGVSVMAMSFGVIILLTEFFRYNFTIKP
jgi:hypothetical protein